MSIDVPHASSHPAAASDLELTVVILNYRTPAMAIDCLASLASELAGRDDRRVLVADNASGDESATRIEQAIHDRGWSSWAALVQADRNAGFAAGNNLGLQAAQQHGGSRYMLLLNSDTLVRPGALDAMLARMHADPAIGMLGPRLEWPDTTRQISAFRFRNPISEFIFAAGTGPITKLLHRFDVPLPIANEPTDADWVSYAAVMLRREMLEQVDLLDEGYFMYFEDIDHCRRARQAGWGVVHDPAPRIAHLRGGSSNVKEASTTRQRRPRYYYASRSRYFKKFYGRAGLVLTNMLWLAGRAIAQGREWTGRPTHICERESRDIWTEVWPPVSENAPGLSETARATPAADRAVKPPFDHATHPS